MVLFPAPYCIPLSHLPRLRGSCYNKPKAFRSDYYFGSQEYPQTGVNTKVLIPAAPSFRVHPAWLRIWYQLYQNQVSWRVSEKYSILPLGYSTGGCHFLWIRHNPTMMKNETKTYIVEYTDQDCIGNQCRTMTVQAESLEDAYDMVDWTFPNMAVDTIYLEGSGAPADWFQV